jgi:hypothetical protein
MTSDSFSNDTLNIFSILRGGVSGNTFSATSTVGSATSSDIPNNMSLSSTSSEMAKSVSNVVNNHMFLYVALILLLAFVVHTYNPDKSSTSSGSKSSVSSTASSRSSSVASSRGSATSSRGSGTSSKSK